MTLIPGHTSDQSAYQSELGGILTIVAMIYNICKYYAITKDHIQIACNGLGPLTQCFAKYQQLSPSMAHFNMIMSIQNTIDKTPIDWHWQHVAFHQEDKTTLLDWWVERNIQMDAEAKAYWIKLNNQGFQHSPCHLPGKGWTVWIDQIKLTSMNWSHFNDQIQSKYSTVQQANKLGNQLDTINWNSIDKFWSGLSIQHQIWKTKWATGWLPMGKNMKQWKQWPMAQCPVCKVPNTSKTVEHLLQVTDLSAYCTKNQRTGGSYCNGIPSSRISNSNVLATILSEMFWSHYPGIWSTIYSWPQMDSTRLHFKAMETIGPN